MAIFPGSAIPSAVSDYEIDNSLRFNTSDSPKLTRTNDAPTNEKIWTWSGWVKKCSSATHQTLMSGAKSGSTRQGYITFNITHDNAIRFNYFNASDTGYEIKTNAVYRDPSSWYHVLVIYNSTNATAADRMQIWINGERQDVTKGSNGDAPLNDTTGINGDGFTQTVGYYNDTSTSQYYVDGYLAEVYFVDGTEYAASTFGELDSTTNQWKPLDSDDVKDDVTFGANGFYQK